MVTNPDEFMTKEESYIQRRHLFKDIWETALILNEKEDIFKKKKIIKTLRMDEVEKCQVGQSKKQRIKNLRHVCKRILDFCDRQDADDKLYRQMAAADTKDLSGAPTTGRKKKIIVRRRKTKSIFGPAKITVGAVPKIEMRKPIAKETSSSTSSISVNKKKVKLRVAKQRKSVKVKLKSQKVKSDDFPKEASAVKRKILRKSTKKKKTLGASVNPKPVQIISV